MAETKAIAVNHTTRGREFIGIVVSAKMQKTVTVEWERRKYVQKYERYVKARTRVKAHNPHEVNAQEGDKVRIKECRPISKTKSFVVVEKLGKDMLALDKVKRIKEATVLKGKLEQGKAAAAAEEAGEEQ